MSNKREARMNAKVAKKEKKDLSFLPVINPKPKVLTQEEIDFYNREGYLKPFDAFSVEEADRNRETFNDLLRRVKKARGDSELRVMP